MSDKHVHPEVIKTFCETKVDLAHNGGVHIYKIKLRAGCDFIISMYVTGESDTPPRSKLQDQLDVNQCPIKKDFDTFKFLSDKFKYDTHSCEFSFRHELISEGFSCVFEGIGDKKNGRYASRGWNVYTKCFEPPEYSECLE